MMKRWLAGLMAAMMLFTTTAITPVVSAEEAQQADPVVSRFAVVSDVHTNPTSPAKTINRLPKVFETAYAYAEAQGGTIDAFVFNGDNINGNESAAGYTNEDEMALFLAGVRDNVKNGSKVLLALARTHDVYDGDGNHFYLEETEINDMIAEYLGTDGSIIPTADWGYQPHLATVSGVPVITLSNDMENGILDGIDDDDNADNSYHNCESWLDTQLAALVAENAERPIFVVFHYPEVGKLGWTQRWGQNSLRDTLNKYPQVIAVNAHVHWDPRLSDSITQDLFTEVYDGAIRDTGGPNATAVSGGSSPIVSYSIIEVTQSGAVTIKYIDPDTGDLLEEANGSGEVLEYSIPKAWDKSTYLYTDEAKFAVDKATFAEDAAIQLNGNTLTFDRAESEHPVIRYRVDITNGTTTNTQYVFSELYNKELPESYTAALALTAGNDYTVTVTAIDGLYRDSANTLTLTGTYSGANTALTGSATVAPEKIYGGNGEKGNVDYPDFKTYATNMDAENITNWGISDIEDLKAWSAFSKSNSCTGLTFHLENDIDMQDRIFNMIGSLYVPFKGTFDGHLHTISNLFIDDTSGMGTGFFVYTSGATISNFGIESGLVQGHVSNRKYEKTTYVAGTTKRTPFTDVIGVGSIAGRADNTDFSHVWNKADVTFRDGHMTEANGFKSPCFAGLVGRAQSACTFVGCYNTGDVHGLDRASGIANWAQNGVNAARISNSFNLGQITCENNNSTEAIGRYNSVTDTDNTFFCYNNYYLEGSATVPTNRNSSTGYTAAGAEEPVALTVTEVTEDLADLLNAKRYYGYLSDNATWATGEDGIPYIASLSESSEAVISISSADELNSFATSSKENSYEGVTVVLKNNIDMSGTADFAGIGNDSYPFKGTFDGNNMTISNLKFTGTATARGMFSYTQAATIKNLTLSAPSMTNAGTNSAFLIGIENGSSLVQNVHISGGTLTASNGYQAGFTGKHAVGTVFRNCSIVGCTFANPSNMQQQSCMVAGTAQNTTFEYCLIAGNTIFAHRNGGLFATYVKNTTVQNCITYGNNVSCNYETFGILGGQLQGTETVTNCVFYDSTGEMNKSNTANADKTTLHLVGYKNVTNFPSATVITTNVYNTKETDLYASVTYVTEDQLASGEVAYALGWSMENGKVTFTDENHKATTKQTYVIEEEATHLYTDYAGKLIGEVPEVTAEGFLGWEQEAGEKAGDMIYTAICDPNATFPITELEKYPNCTKFTVSTPAEFKFFADMVTAKKIGSNITILQTANIDLTEYPNIMVGTERSAAAAFSGTYDGQNHTISNYYYNNTSTLYAGLFKGLSGTIKNLVVANAKVYAKTHSAILVGDTYGTENLIDNVRLVDCTVDVKERRGGFMLYGFSTGNFTVKNCTVTGCELFTGATTGNPLGLIATKADSTDAACVVENTYVYGNTINVEAANTDVGEFVGDGRNVVLTNCGSFGNVYKGVAPRNKAAFIAVNSKVANKITNCYSDLTTAYYGTAPGVNTNNRLGVTAAAIADGSLAYALAATSDANWVQNTYPRVAQGKAVTKHTYLVDGAEYAVRYTDYEGNELGEAVADPEGAFTGWSKTEETETATVFTATFAALGDVNGDTIQDTRDVVLMLRHLLGYSTGVTNATADMNNDGRISIIDAVLLLRAIVS